MNFSRRQTLLCLAAAVMPHLTGCAEFPVHIGMILLNFEIHQNGQKVHSFQADIRDDASLSQKWELLMEKGLPKSLVTADKNGGAILAGEIEIRMIHAGTLVSKAVLSNVLLTQDEKAGAWKVKQDEMPRIKKAATDGRIRN